MKTEAERLKGVIADIIPALEVASGLKADDFRQHCQHVDVTPDEWAALWMARAILEIQN